MLFKRFIYEFTTSYYTQNTITSHGARPTGVIMTNRIPIILLSITLFAKSLSGVTGEQSIKHTVTDTTSRTVDNHAFIFTIETEDGIVSETRTVDDVIVTPRDYEKALAEAERAEHEREIELLRADAEKKAVDMRRVQKKAAQKLIETGLDHVKAELKRIDEYALEPHLLWDAKTITSHEEYDRLIKKTIPQAEKTVASTDDEYLENVDQIKADAKQLEDYAQRLSALFLESVNHVIAHTQDTELLKRLMEIA